jgi:uncharacterized protein YqeY
MIIIEKYFEEKLSDREIGEFVSNFVTLKGDANMDVIYDEEMIHFTSNLEFMRIS